MKHKFKIGQKFVPVGQRNKSTWTVTDLLTTTNAAGEIVKIRYVAAHELFGQTIRDWDVLEATIARGILTEVA